MKNTIKFDSQHERGFFDSGVNTFICCQVLLKFREIWSGIWHVEGKRKVFLFEGDGTIMMNVKWAKEYSHTWQKYLMWIWARVSSHDFRFNFWSEVAFSWSNSNCVIDSKLFDSHLIHSQNKILGRRSSSCRYLTLCDFHKFSLNLKRDITRKWHVYDEKYS